MHLLNSFIVAHKKYKNKKNALMKYLHIDNNHLFRNGRLSEIVKEQNDLALLSNLPGELAPTKNSDR